MLTSGNVTNLISQALLFIAVRLAFQTFGKVRASGGRQAFRPFRED
jgi:hypothetical protein